MTKLRTNETRDPHKLKNHPLNIKLYGDKPPKPEFVAGVKKHGILEPLLITVDDVVVAGHTRKNAARIAGLKEVPVIVLRDVTDSLDLEELLIISNRQREKDNETLAREAARLAGIEEARAEARQKANLKLGAARPPVGTNAHQRENPEKNDDSGRAREKVAEALGVGEQSANKLIKAGKALEDAEESGDTEKAEEIKAGLQKSVSAGHKAATKEDEPEEEANISDAFGPVTDKLVTVFEAVSTFKGLQKKLGSFQNELEDLQGSDAGAAIPIQEMLNHLKELKQALKFSIPYCECPKCRRSKKACDACEGFRWITEPTYKRCRTEEDEKWLKGDRA